MDRMNNISEDSVRKQHRLCSLVHMGFGQEVNPDHAKSKKMSGIRVEFRTKPFTSREDAAYEVFYRIGHSQ